MPGLLTIDTVKMYLRRGDLERVEVGGRTDIINHPEVNRYIDDHDGKIVSIGGEFEYKNQTYDFTVSYATEPEIELGRVAVDKKGKATGDLETRQEAFDLLHDLFEDYFVDY